MISTNAIGVSFKASKHLTKVSVREQMIQLSWGINKTLKSWPEVAEFKAINPNIIPKAMKITEPFYCMCVKGTITIIVIKKTQNGYLFYIYIQFYTEKIKRKTSL